MWWQPVSITIMPPVQLHAGNFNNKESLAIGVYNYTGKTQNGFVLLNNKRHLEKPFTAATRFQILGFERPLELSPGTNKISFETPAFTANSFITDWKAKLANQTTESVTLDNYFNDKVTNIFKNEYLSPRPATATLQLPTQGIGDWTHPLKTANINDSGLRKLAGARNQIELPQGIPFSTPSDTVAKNILFTSQWDNYPNEATIPLAGKAMHIYLLMAGSTNPMQSRITNGAVVVRYTDGSGDTLLLKNPENWYPIEQDYLDDGYAFQTDAPRPPRVHLQTGKITSAYDNTELEYNGKMIEGGAATVLDLPLNPHKTLQELSLQTWANDVVIGLMAATLVR